MSIQPKLEFTLPNGYLVFVYEDNMVLVYEGLKGVKLGYDNKGKAVYRMGKCLHAAEWLPASMCLKPHIGILPSVWDKKIIEQAIKSKMTVHEARENT